MNNHYLRMIAYKNDDGAGSGESEDGSEVSESKKPEMVDPEQGQEGLTALPEKPNLEPGAEDEAHPRKPEMAMKLKEEIKDEEKVPKKKLMDRFNTVLGSLSAIAPRKSWQRRLLILLLIVGIGYVMWNPLGARNYVTDSLLRMSSQAIAVTGFEDRARKAEQRVVQLEETVKEAQENVGNIIYKNMTAQYNLNIDLDGITIKPYAANIYMVAPSKNAIPDSVGKIMDHLIAFASDSGHDAIVLGGTMYEENGKLVWEDYMGEYRPHWFHISAKLEAEGVKNALILISNPEGHYIPFPARSFVTGQLKIIDHGEFKFGWLIPTGDDHVEISSSNIDGEMIGNSFKLNFRTQTGPLSYDTDSPKQIVVGAFARGKDAAKTFHEWINTISFGIGN